MMPLRSDCNGLFGHKTTLLLVLETEARYLCQRCESFNESRQVTALNE
jgi:hypothetical protein